MCKAKGGFVSPILFEKTLQTLRKKQIAGDETVIALYCWGEPFLHPQLPELIKIINGHSFRYGFSTNASKIPLVDAAFVNNLDHLWFSMPGFSEKSYRRVHGFSFDVIINNIKRITEAAKAQRFSNIAIRYHVYQFNVDELMRCREFADELGIRFEPAYAILNNWSLVNGYFDNTLDVRMLRQISQDVFCHGIDEAIAKAPMDYDCPQYQHFVLDEQSNVSICCQVSRDEQFRCGDLFAGDMDEMMQYRRNNPVCKACIGKGLAYYLHNFLVEPGFYRQMVNLKERLEAPEWRGSAGREFIKKCLPPVLLDLVRRVSGHQR